jgi:membrane fusion protein (multidrug efflux system)
MFVDVQASFGGGDSVIALPASGGELRSLRQLGVRRVADEGSEDAQGISRRGSSVSSRSGPNRGDQVAIVSGLKPGEEVVSSGVFKLRSGAAVLVNNKISPSNNPAPKPEDS